MSHCVHVSPSNKLTWSADRNFAWPTQFHSLLKSSNGVTYCLQPIPLLFSPGSYSLRCLVFPLKSSKWFRESVGPLLPSPCPCPPARPSNGIYICIARISTYHTLVPLENLVKKTVSFALWCGSRALWLRMNYTGSKVLRFEDWSKGDRL